MTTERQPLVRCSSNGTRSRSLQLLLLALSLALAATGRADEAERARAHFEAGRVHYNLGDYEAAVRELSAGYRVVPRPEFLVNLGQAYRRLGQLERAREMYQRFLADTPSSDPARPQVRALIAEVQREIDRVRAAAKPPASEPEPEPVKADPATVPMVAPRIVAPPMVAPPIVVAKTSHVDPPPPPSFWRRHWWIVPVTTVALAGAGVGIYFVVRPSGGPDCNAAGLGCLDLRH